MSAQGTSQSPSGENQSTERCPARGPDSYTWPSPEMSQCPYDFYSALRSEAPVYQRPGADEFMVSRWEDVRYILEHPEIFSNDPRHAEGKATRNPLKELHGAEIDDPGSQPIEDQMMALTDPPAHTGKRRMALEMMSAPVMREYQPVIARFCNELIDGFIADGQAEFCTQFAEPLPIYVICHILGLPLEDAADLKRWGRVEMTGARYLPKEVLVTQIEAQQEIVMYVQRALKERAEEPTDDYLSKMIAWQQERDGEPNMAYLTGEASLLLMAGNVTTSHTIGSAMMLLLQNPDQLEKLLADRSLIPAMFEETLRMEAPVPWLERYVREDTELHGVPLPKGTIVQWLIASANHDGERFEDPDRFWIERPRVIKDHLAFGRGTHRCVGAPLAKLEAKMAFEILLDRLGELRLTPGKNDFRRIESISFRAPQAVNISFDPA